MMKKMIFVVLLIVNIFFNISLSNNFSVNPMTVNMIGAQNETLTITNYNTKKNIYVELLPFIYNPYDKTDEKLTLKEARKIGFFISSNKIVIPAGQFRYVNLITTKNNLKKDIIIKLKVEERINGFMTASNENQQTDEKISAAIKTRLVYNLFVALRPEKFNIAIDFILKNDQLEILNNGNTNARIFDIMACSSDKYLDCKQISPEFRIYADQKKLVILNEKIKYIKLRYQVSSKIFDKKIKIN